MNKIVLRLFSGVMVPTVLMSSFTGIVHAETTVPNDDEIILKTVFDAPSEDWESECTQLGNGFLGAMVYGGYAVDQIQLNENSIWWGGPVGEEGYDGGNSGEASDHYNNLSLLRDYLQETMADFTANKSAYIDDSGNIVSNDYPDLSPEAQGWLDSLKGRKTYFGNYQPMGDMYTSDYLTPEIAKANNVTAVSNEEENTTGASIADGDVATDWVSDNTDMPVSVELTYDEPITFKGYKLTASSLRDTEDNAPKSWTLYGSDDGETYVEIDSRSGEEFYSLGASEIFELESEVTYKYLKFEVQRTKRNGSVARLSEIDFMPEAELVAETAEYTDYERVLDLNNSIANVSYKKNGIGYNREYFVSYPNNFMGMRLTTDTEDALDKYIYLGSVHSNAEFEAEVRDNIGYVTMRFQLGTFEENERVACQLRIIADDGATISYDESNPKYIHVENADDIKVYMSAGTNYVLCMDDTFDYLTDEDPLDKVEQRLDLVQNQDYDSLKDAHIADYKELFGRVSLSLNGAQFPDYMTTKELVQGYKAGTNTDEENRYLEMLYYQMGRYLLISCSREGSLPANLQGIWNNSTSPPWKCGYTTNINAQMNYWLAETTNLSECHEPLTTFIKAQVERGHRTAQLYHYNVNHYEETGEFIPARGWTCYHNLNIWGNTAPDKSSCFYFPAAAAWLCQHIWEHYAFTLDKEFLEDNFYVMKEAALFWVDNLVVDERDGAIVSSPGHSPEHGGITMGTTGDQVIIWELFNNTIKAAEVLGIDDTEMTEIKDSMSKLSLPKIGLAGQFQEWKDEVTLDITGHNGYKHVTHLFAIYPGSFVVPGRSEQDDAYADAIRESLNVRGDGGTGWGKAWKIGLWARAHDGERAGDMVESIINGSTLFNLFDTHTPFQIDGNFGATAGMTEMMLQSEGGPVELMPAVPSAWKSGNVKGLRARGSITVDIDWNDNILETAKLVSDVDNEALSVNYPGIAQMKLYDSEFNEVEFAAESNDMITFAARAGEEYTLAADGDALILSKAAVNRADGAVELNFNRAVPTGTDAYCASYDADGRLIGISKVSGTGASDTITLAAPTETAAEKKVYIWNADMSPLTETIDVSKLASTDDPGGTDDPEVTPAPIPEGYLVYETFDDIRGSWGFAGKDRTIISDDVLKFEGGGAGEIDIKQMDESVTECRVMDIEFDWRSDVDVSSSGRTAIFELLDKNDRTVFALYSNTKSSEGIKYSTEKNAYDDTDLWYEAFPVWQSKNNDWYHIAMTVNFISQEITKLTVTKDGNEILALENVPTAAVNLEKMKMIDYYSVAGMSLDNVKIKRADIDASGDTGIESAVIKGKVVKMASGVGSVNEISDFATLRVSKDAAVNPYKLTEFAPSYAASQVKAVKYDAGTTDFSDFEARAAYNDEDIINNDIFIVEVTAENGDKAYYGVIVEVSDGSDEAYLETFAVYDGDKNLIENFEFSMDTEPGGDYGSAEVLKSTETVTLQWAASDERLTQGDDVGAGGVIVTVNGSEDAYNAQTGEIALAEGDNVIKVSVTSYDGTMNGVYTFNVVRSGYVFIEPFDSTDVSPLWYSQYTTINVTEEGALHIDQSGGSGPRSATGWLFESDPIVSDKLEVDFDLRLAAGNHSAGESGFYLVGSGSYYKGNGVFDGNGGIVGIHLPANTNEENCMSILSGSGDLANPTKTPIANPGGEGRVFPWAHVNMVVDFTTKQTTIKITTRNNPSEVWFDGTVEGFIDPSATDFKGFHFWMGRANSYQEIDNIKIKPF